MSKNHPSDIANDVVRLTQQMGAHLNYKGYSASEKFLNRTTSDVSCFWKEVMANGLQDLNYETKESMFESLRELAYQRLGIRKFEEFNMILAEFINNSAEIIDLRDLEDPSITAAQTNTLAAQNYQEIS